MYNVLHKTGVYINCFITHDITNVQYSRGKGLWEAAKVKLTRCFILFDSCYVRIEIFCWRKGNFVCFLLKSYLTQICSKLYLYLYDDEYDVIIHILWRSATHPLIKTRRGLRGFEDK